MELFLRTKAGVNASGDYDPITKTLTVKKGSTVSPDVHTTGKFRSANSVMKYREMYCNVTVTKENVVFKSASTAANFITGRSTNGLITWKNKDGKTLKALIAE